MCKYVLLFVYVVKQILLMRVHVFPIVSIGKTSRQFMFGDHSLYCHGVCG